MARLLIAILVVGGVTIAWGICPRYCTCDVTVPFQVICSGRNLASTYLEVPYYTTTLDLSRNVISIIRSHEFQNAGLKNLKTLLLHNNQIHIVDSLSFVGLDQLQHLDLSRNHLTRLEPATFLTNKNLKTLNVSNNHLGVITQGNFLNAPYLQELQMAHCSLVYLPTTLYLGLDNLRVLNISDNNIIALHPTTLSTLSRVQHIDISQNPLTCNTEATHLLYWLQDHKITFPKFCEATSNHLAPPKELHKMVLAGTEVLTEQHVKQTNPKIPEQQKIGKEEEEEHKIELVESHELQAEFIQDGDLEAELIHDKEFEKITSETRFNDELIEDDQSQETSPTTNHAPNSLMETFQSIPSLYAGLCGLQLGLILGSLTMFLCLRKAAKQPPAPPKRTFSLLRHPFYDANYVQRTSRNSTDTTDRNSLIPPGTPPSPYRATTAM